MIQGLWSVEFASSAGYEGAGVIVFESGRLFGGDSRCFYLGDYSMGPDHQLFARIRVTHYAGEPLPIFGRASEMLIVMAGKQQQDGRVAGAGVPHNATDPSLSISFRLTKRADLR